MPRSTSSVQVKSSARSALTPASHSTALTMSASAPRGEGLAQFEVGGIAGAAQTHNAGFAGALDEVRCRQRRGAALLAIGMQREGRGRRLDAAAGGGVKPFDGGRLRANGCLPHRHDIAMPHTGAVCDDRPVMAGRRRERVPQQRRRRQLGQGAWPLPSALPRHQLDAIHRARRHAQLAARAAFRDDRVDKLVGADDGIHGAGIQTQGAADAGRLVDERLHGECLGRGCRLAA